MGVQQIVRRHALTIKTPFVLPPNAEGYTTEIDAFLPEALKKG